MHSPDLNVVAAILDLPDGERLLWPCLFPDTPCEESRHMGTGYCQAHLPVMRTRSALAQDAEDRRKDAEWRANRAAMENQ